MPEPASMLRVRASAGSGKTYTLTGHFLRLLLGSEDVADESLVARQSLVELRGDPRAPSVRWPEIMAVTFTNQAAGEMKERIIRRLKGMALGLESDIPDGWSPELAARWLDIILRRYGALNIRTIDSLLHMLVRLAALELGLPPDFDPVFSEDEALAPLVDEILEQSRHDPALCAELEAACLALLRYGRHRGFVAGKAVRKKIFELVFALAGVSEDELGTPDQIAEKLETACADLRDAARTLSECCEAGRLPLSHHARGALAKCLACTPHAPPPSSTMLYKETFESWVLKAGKDLVTDTHRFAYAGLRDAVCTMDGEAKLLRGALTLMPFIALAQRVRQAMPDYLQRQRLFPATLAPALARQVLEGGYGVSEAFCRMGARLTHILVDEFQDTSREQWSALRPLVHEALARGGSLTWVGDVKQAIYNWRGGDAALFGEVLDDERLRAVVTRPQTDTLPTNWRSRSAIVRANNSVFSRLARPDTAHAVLAALMPPKTPARVLEEGAASIADAFLDSAQLESGRPGGYVCLEPLHAASSVVLKGLVLERLQDCIREVASRRPYGDITVLVRTNPQAELVAAHLLAAGIPVVTENSLLLAEHPLVVECIDLLRWLHTPDNEVAFWNLVSGQLLGHALPPADMLDAWLSERRRDVPLARAFSEAFTGPWAALLAPFYERAGLMTPYDALREALRQWNAWERFAPDGPFLQRLLEILLSAERQGHTSLASFLEYWALHGMAEKAPMPSHLNAVRVMTIHKSKGLQFPVVFVPWHDFMLKSDAPPTRVAMPDFTIITPRSAALGDEHYAALCANAREMLNVLYVAWTRAEDELYGLFCAPPQPGLETALKIMLHGLDAPWQDENGVLSLGVKPEPLPGSISACEPAAMQETDRQLPAPGLEQEPEQEPQQEPEQERQLSSAHTRYDKAPVTSGPLAEESPEHAQASRHALYGLDNDRPNDDWLPMDWLPRLRIFRNSPDALVFTAKRRGSFIHACLDVFARHVKNTAAVRHAPDLAAGAHTVIPDAVTQAVAQARRAFPMPVPEDLPEQAERILTWFAACPGALHWLATGTAEQSVLSAEGNMYRPDLVVPPAPGASVWTVVEYKTGQPDPMHREQLGRYLELVKRIADMPATGALVYLDQYQIIPVCRANGPDHGHDAATPETGQEKAGPKPAQTGDSQP